MKNPLWKPLEQGDKVAFLPSSSPVTQGCKNSFTKVLDEWGLKLYDSPIKLDDSYGDQGTAKQRAQAIIDAIENEEVKAIFLRGGSGGDEVIEHLKHYEKEKTIKNRGVLLIRFSDASQFHHYLGSIGAVSPVQGCDPAFLIPLEDFQSRSNFLTDQLSKNDVTDEVKQKIRDEKVARNNIQREATQKMYNFLMQGEEIDSSLICVNDAARNVLSLEGKMVVFKEHSRRADYRVTLEKEYNPIMLLEGGFGGREVERGIGFSINYLKETAQINNLQAILVSKSDGRCFFNKKLEDSDLSEIKKAI